MSVAKTITSLGSEDRHISKNHVATNAQVEIGRSHAKVPAYAEFEALG